MVSFSAARGAVPAEIQQETAVNPGVESRTAAAAIESFGKFGGEIRKQLIENELTRDLENASLLTDALNAPETVITEDGEVDISKADPDGVIKDATPSAERLKRARLQGKISQNQVALEGEALLRKAVAKAPGFEPELRRLVADAVGFDVTGAATRTFFGNPRSNGASSRLTETEKQWELSHAVSAGSNGRVTPQTVFNMISQQKLAELEMSEANRKLEQGRIAASEYSQLAGVNFEQKGLMLILGAEGENGKIADPDGVKAAIRQERMRFDAMMDLSINQGGLMLDSEARKASEDHLKDIETSLLELTDNKDFLALLQKETAIMQTMTEKQVREMLPGMMALSVAFPNSSERLLELFALAGGDAASIQLFKDTNPLFSGAVDVLRATTPESMIGILNDVLNPAGSGGSGGLSQEQIDQRNAAAILTFDNAIRAGDQEAASRSAEYMFTNGLRRKPLSQIAASKGGYGVLDDTAAGLTRVAYEADTKTTMGNLVRQLKSDDLRIAWDADSRRFRIATAEGLTGAAARIGQGPGVIGAGNTAAASDLEYANEVLVGMQVNNPAFLRDATITDPNQWAEDFVSAVNEAVETNEVETPGFLQNPKQTPGTTLNALPAGTFEDSQGNVFTVGEDGSVTDVVRAQEGDPITHVPARAATPTFKESQQPIIDIITKGAQEAGIDERLLIAIAKVESSLNPEASNNPDNPGVAKFKDGKQVFSSAQGLFQSLVANFERFGPKDGDRTNPEHSLTAAINYIKLLEGTTEDLDELLIRWHDGESSKGASPEALKFARKVKRELGL